MKGHTHSFLSRSLAWLSHCCELSLSSSSDDSWELPHDLLKTFSYFPEATLPTSLCQGFSRDRTHPGPSSSFPAKSLSLPSAEDPN